MRAARRLATVLVALGALAAAMPGLVTPAAAAGPTSQLEATEPPSTSPITTLTIDMAVDSTRVVDVRLDDDCPAAYGTGQVYGVAAISSDTGVATIAPSSVPGLACDGTGASFTLTGVANGTSLVTFDPVAANSGLQRKLVKVVLEVTVVNATTTDPSGDPTRSKRPAAPAVANAYLGDAGLVSACKTAYADAGKPWRGHLIKDVARWAATNHLGKKKNDRDVFATDNAWVRFVQVKVDSLCGYTP